MSGRGSNVVTSALVIVTVVLLVPLVTVLFFKDGLYYPQLTVTTAQTVDAEFLFNGRKSEASCKKLIDNIVNGIVSVCPACQIKEKECAPSLEVFQRRALSSDPLPIPSSRIPDGVVLYQSTQPHIALSACMETQRLSAARNSSDRVTCFQPHNMRPFTVPRSQVDSAAFFASVWFAAVSCAICWLICLVLVRYQRFHGHISMDAIEGGPQKFHAVATPRIGGVAILIALLFTGAGLVPVEQRFSIEEYGYLILAALPAFAGGFAEDITKKIGVLPRLACTMAAAALCSWLLAAVLRRLDIPMVDPLLLWTPLAVAFTIFAVGGVANAINIIDGYNGLVGGYAILVLAAISWVATQVGDMFILTAALSMAGALVGFLVWNYPKGRIFLGDGGAYFLGFWLAELSVLLVARHPTVSPWFPLLLLLYPVFETIFSIYRRKVCRGCNPGHPDALHFHQLIYMRLARLGVGSRDAKTLTIRNSAVAGYIWTANSFFIIPAISFWNNTAALASVALIFCCAYTWLYNRLIRWRAPRWLIMSPKN